MPITGKLILAALALLFGAALLPSILALAAVVTFLTGLFGVAVFLWAFVLLGERWIEDGFKTYNYLDALDDSVQGIFQGLRRQFATRRYPSLRDRFVAFLPLLKVRTKIVLAAVFAFPIAFVVQCVTHGVPSAARATKRLFAVAFPETWTGRYL